MSPKEKRNCIISSVVKYERVIFETSHTLCAGGGEGQRLSRSGCISIVNGDFLFTRHEFYNSFTVTWLSEFRSPAESPPPPPTHLQVDTRVCRPLYSFYFLACIMHVEASLHCQWRIGKVPPISDRRHFSGQSVCRRFLENVLTRTIVQVLGKLWKFFTPSTRSIHLSWRMFCG